jgi:hypothetical protein
VNIPEPERPHPDAMSRGEVARALGQPYMRVYYWTAAAHRREARLHFRPRWTTRRGHQLFDWFAPEQVEQLRRFLDALELVQEVTGDRRASRRRAPGEAPA